eukprot:3736049-Prymnesium_polylepis.2
MRKKWPNPTEQSHVVPKAARSMDATLLDTTLDVCMRLLDAKGDYGYKSAPPRPPHPLPARLPTALRRPLVVAVTAEEDKLLTKVGQVLTLWQDCGKPFETLTLSTYYVSDMWNVRRLHKDLDVMEQSMAVRARGYTLGHELFQAPLDVYQVMADLSKWRETVPTTLYLFLSTCKTFEPRRLHLLKSFAVGKMLKEASHLYVTIEEKEDE